MDLVKVREVRVKKLIELDYFEDILENCLFWGFFIGYGGGIRLGFM